MASTGELDSEIAQRLKFVSARSRYLCTITVLHPMFISYAYYHRTNSIHRFAHAFRPVDALLTLHHVLQLTIQPFRLYPYSYLPIKR